MHATIWLDTRVPTEFARLGEGGVLGGRCAWGMRRRRGGRCLLGEEIVLHNERRREGVDLVVDLVLERALLGGEAVAERP